MMDCPECGAKPGAWHQVGCSWAQCPYCGDHLTACDHEPPRDDQLRWAGCDFWLAACLQLGLFGRRTAAGWVRCGADDPGTKTFSGAFFLPLDTGVMPQKTHLEPLLDASYTPATPVFP
jgi:hypothetical protein